MTAARGVAQRPAMGEVRRQPDGLSILRPRHALLGRRRPACAFIMPLVSASTDRRGDVARIDGRVGARSSGMASQAGRCYSTRASCTLASGVCDSPRACSGAKPMTPPQGAGGGARLFPLDCHAAHGVIHRQAGCRWAAAWRHVQPHVAHRTDFLAQASAAACGRRKTAKPGTNPMRDHRQVGSGPAVEHPHGRCSASTRCPVAVGLHHLPVQCRSSPSKISATPPRPKLQVRDLAGPARVHDIGEAIRPTTLCHPLHRAAAAASDSTTMTKAARVVAALSLRLHA